MTTCRSSVAHVDPSRLYGDKTESHLYARMIDGRTIFQYLHFIEPLLRSANPQSSRLPEGVSESRHGQAFFMLARQSTDPERTISRRLSSIPIEDARASVLDRVRLAAYAIDELGLGFFLDLGIASIAIGRERPTTHYEAALPADSEDPTEDALALLRAAATNMVELWSRAETAQGRAFEPCTHISPKVLRELFADSVCIEFHRRRSHANLRILEDQLRQRHFGNHRIEAMLDSVPGLELTRELVAYWIPLWNRAAVIFDSPFDTMNTLQPSQGADSWRSDQI